VRLILVNGTPASGKSTLAERYVANHPLALNLDVDVVRGLLGGWLDRASEAGGLARRLAIAMARVHLAAGHDVVVPQFLGRLEFVLELEQLAGQLGVPFVEVALVSDAQEVRERFARRTAAADRPAHRDADALLARSGGPEALGEMSDRLLAVIAARPRTTVITSYPGQVDRAYEELLAVIGENGA